MTSPESTANSIRKWEWLLLLRFAISVSFVPLVVLFARLNKITPSRLFATVGISVLRMTLSCLLSHVSLKVFIFRVWLVTPPSSTRKCRSWRTGSFRWYPFPGGLPELAGSSGFTASREFSDRTLGGQLKILQLWMFVFLKIKRLPGGSEVY